MMATIFNSSILNSAILDSAILHKTLTQTSSIWLKLIHSDSTWWWQPSWILLSWNSAILHKTLTQTTSIWLTHSFSLKLMISVILNSAILDSDTAILDSNTLLSSLIFTQKHSPSTLTLNQTNSIWLTWWWQPSWILPSWIQPFCTKLWLKLVQSDSNSFILTQLDDGSHLEFCHQSWIRPFCTKKLLTHSFLTQLDDGTHLEFCHIGFRLNLKMAAILNLAILNSDSHKNTLTPFWLWLKLMMASHQSGHFKLIHSHSNWWLQELWMLLSLILPFC